MVKGQLHLLNTPERLSRKYIELVISNALETGLEHMTQEQVIVKVDSHLVLELMEVLDGAGHSRVLLEAWHHELLLKAVRSDLLREWRVEGA